MLDLVKQHKADFFNYDIFPCRKILKDLQLIKSKIWKSEIDDQD